LQTSRLQWYNLQHNPQGNAEAFPANGRQQFQEYIKMNQQNLNKWKFGMMPREAVAATLDAAGGQFFGLTFRKKDGTVRRMIAKRSAHTDSLKGVGKKTPDHIVNVYDMRADGWRSFDLTRLLELRIGGKRFQII
jgi:hypothetical protein